MEGTLRKNEIGRWEIVDEDGDCSVELTCGDVFKIETERGMKKTRMEAWNKIYYAVGGYVLKEGLKAEWRQHPRMG